MVSMKKFGGLSPMPLAACAAGALLMFCTGVLHAQGFDEEAPLRAKYGEVDVQMRAAMEDSAVAKQKARDAEEAVVKTVEQLDIAKEKVQEIARDAADKKEFAKAVAAAAAKGDAYAKKAMADQKEAAHAKEEAAAKEAADANVAAAAKAASDAKSKADAAKAEEEAAVAKEKQLREEFGKAYAAIRAYEQEHPSIDYDPMPLKSMAAELFQLSKVFSTVGHFIAVAQVRREGKPAVEFRYDSFPRVERVVGEDGVPFVRLAGKGWVKSADWGKSGTPAPAQRSAELDAVAEMAKKTFQADKPDAQEGLGCVEESIDQSLGRGQIFFRAGQGETAGRGQIS